MSSTGTVVVALGGNALLRRGEPLEAANQAAAARRAAQVLGQAALRYRLVVTHGNGPQVGLLALMSDAYTETDPYPLDVLGSETEGQIGYVVEMQLDNFVDHQFTVAVITRVVVDAADPAFHAPSKFIGPVYDENEARTLAERRGWVVKADGQKWRRVVPSPEPRRIVQLPAIRQLVENGFLVVCAGGGCARRRGRGRAPSRCGGRHRQGPRFRPARDRPRRRHPRPRDRRRRRVRGLRHAAAACDHDRDARRPSAWRLPAGSMGPKVEAAARFVESSGGRAVIGALDDLLDLLEGRAGTQVVADGRDSTYAGVAEGAAALSSTKGVRP